MGLTEFVTSTEEVVMDMDDRSDEEASPILVVAIDYGTTYDGYAFSFKSKTTEIKTLQNLAKSLISLKTRTVKLVEQDREFSAFGYEAGGKYEQLLEDYEAEGWALFRHFQMHLYNIPILSKGYTDLSGKVKIPVISALSLAIQYLKDHVLARRKLVINESDYHFVLPLLGILNVSARLLMREAAAHARTLNDRLRLALKSEAAFDYNKKFCNHFDRKTPVSSHMHFDIEADCYVKPGAKEAECREGFCFIPHNIIKSLLQPNSRRASLIEGNEDSVFEPTRSLGIWQFDNDTSFKEEYSHKEVNVQDVSVTLKTIRNFQTHETIFLYVNGASPIQGNWKKNTRGRFEFGRSIRNRKYWIHPKRNRYIKEKHSLGHASSCKICYGEKACVVFLPCSHMIACENCSSRLQNCAMCRSVIKGSFVVELNMSI